MRWIEIIEEKQTIDFRHSVQAEPPSPRGKKEPTPMIAPEDGFYFEMGNDGTLVLHSAQNSNVSGAVIYGGWDQYWKQKVKLPWNQPGGLVDFRTKTITISKESYSRGTTSLYRQRNIADIKEFQKLLRKLIPYGVTADYKVKGLSDMPSTVGEILKLRDPTDQMFSGEQQIVMYHGTSMKRWKEIEASGKGLVPGNTRDDYIDLKNNYSEHNIYLATSPKGASFYGKRQAKKEKDNEYVILQVTVPDTNKLVSDDAWVTDWSSRREAGGGYGVVSRHPHYNGSDPRALHYSGRELGEFGYKGRIPMSFIKVLKIGKVA